MNTISLIVNRLITEPISITLLFIWTIVGLFILDFVVIRFTKWHFNRKWKKIGEL